MGFQARFLKNSSLLRQSNLHPRIFAKCFRRTPAAFEECPFEGTSYTVYYTVFQGYLQSDKLL